MASAAMQLSEFVPPTDPVAPAPLQDPVLTLRASCEELGTDWMINIPVNRERFDNVGCLVTELGVAISAGGATNMRKQMEMVAFEVGVQKRAQTRREQDAYVREMHKAFEKMSATLHRAKHDYYREIDHLRHQLCSRERTPEEDPEKVVFFDPDGYKVPDWKEVADYLDLRRTSIEREDKNAKWGGLPSKWTALKQSLQTDPSGMPIFTTEAAESDDEELILKATKSAGVQTDLKCQQQMLSRTTQVGSGEWQTAEMEVQTEELEVCRSDAQTDPVTLAREDSRPRLRRSRSRSSATDEAVQLRVAGAPATVNLTFDGSGSPVKSRSPAKSRQPSPQKRPLVSSQAPPCLDIEGGALRASDSEDADAAAKQGNTRSRLAAAFKLAKALERLAGERRSEEEREEAAQSNDDGRQSTASKGLSPCERKSLAAKLMERRVAAHQKHLMRIALGRLGAGDSIKVMADEDMAQLSTDCSECCCPSPPISTPPPPVLPVAAPWARQVPHELVASYSNQSRPTAAPPMSGKLQQLAPLPQPSNQKLLQVPSLHAHAGAPPLSPSAAKQAVVPHVAALGLETWQPGDRSAPWQPRGSVQPAFCAQQPRRLTASPAPLAVKSAAASPVPRSPVLSRAGSPTSKQNSGGFRDFRELSLPKIMDGQGGPGALAPARPGAAVRKPSRGGA